MTNQIDRQRAALAATMRAPRRSACAARPSALRDTAPRPVGSCSVLVT